MISFISADVAVFNIRKNRRDVMLHSDFQIFNPRKDLIICDIFNAGEPRKDFVVCDIFNVGEPRKDLVVCDIFNVGEPRKASNLTLMVTSLSLPYLFAVIVILSAPIEALVAASSTVDFLPAAVPVVV